MPLSNLVFNKNVDYCLMLTKLRWDFQTNWDRSTLSPHGGIGEFETITVLGSGAFGTVKLCRDRRNNRVYAIKCLLKKHIIRERQVKNVCNEKRLLSSMYFPFLVGLEFSCKDNDYVYLAMPFISGGELFTYHRRVKKFTEPQAKFYAAQVFLALEYMHALQLVYRDLKPENILLDLNGYIKIADFGFTKKVEKRTHTLCGTPEYIAPEILNSKPYGSSVDWWAFGVLLYEFVSGFSPFSIYGDDIMLMYTKICEANYKIPKYFSPQLRHLIDNLLQVDLSRRFGNMINGERDIKDHYWFESIDWFEILNGNVDPPYKPRVKHLEDYSHFETERVTEVKCSKNDQYSKEFSCF